MRFRFRLRTLGVYFICVPLGDDAALADAIILLEQPAVRIV